PFHSPCIILMTHFGGQKSNYGNNLNNPNCNALFKCIAVLSPLDHQDFEQLRIRRQLTTNVVELWIGICRITDSTGAKGEYALSSWP
ncbi:MAG: hypothetical protein ABIK28_04400, partial [Planctomycetota bacterium]